MREYFVQPVKAFLYFMSLLAPGRTPRFGSNFILSRRNIFFYSSDSFPFTREHAEAYLHPILPGYGIIKQDGEIFSSPALGDLNEDGIPELIFGSNDNHLYVIDTNTKEVLWDYKAEDKIISAPSVGDVNGDGKVEVVFTSLDNFIYVLKGSAGELLWKFDGGDWLSSESFNM